VTNDLSDLAQSDYIIGYYMPMARSSRFVLILVSGYNNDVPAEIEFADAERFTEETILG
jgi:hypothetical protein